MDQTRPRQCPRCTGRLAAASDWVSRYMTCLMCGFVDEPTRIEIGQTYIEVARGERTVHAPRPLRLHSTRP